MPATMLGGSGVARSGLMAGKSNDRRRRRRPAARDLDPPPVAPDGRKPEPLTTESPEIARDYDPGFTPPDADADPWLDEGRPEASG